MNRVVISQPRYLPFLPYIQRLNHADTFVILDNVQRQYLGFENRNRIIVNSKLKWLTIPISSSRKEKICLSKISGTCWIQDHINSLLEAYKKHTYFDISYIDAYYFQIANSIEHLSFSYSKILIKFIYNLVDIFDLHANIVIASELDLPCSKGVENLFNIFEAVNGAIYISGANGRNYGVKEYFENRGKKVVFHDPKPIGNECNIPFLAFFDPLFNIGYSDVVSFIKSPLELSEV
ncbi:MAG: WbqC family protein [Oscillatoriaceae bacterium SKYG93]|nr:WbqC family protein [Oscillatoriaceae bacterium SKYG93]MDW8451990.1 WbqC family protein [Oscillatoriaceae cyanobacterium SKYGB_i_bin93]